MVAYPYREDDSYISTTRVIEVYLSVSRELYYISAGEHQVSRGASGLTSYIRYRHVLAKLPGLLI